MALKEQVEYALKKHRLLRRGQSVLVAVSGGLDSMVLLDLIHACSRVHDFRLVIAHYNHRLRGAASAADARLVQRTARKLRIPCVLGEGSVGKVAREEKLSLEMAARQCRHQFLAAAARERGIRTVATAHHADDQLELFFLRLIRGAGSDGLSGMTWSSPSPVRASLRIIRPLLEVTKPQLLDYAREQGIAFREDATNDNLDIQRNRIRHELLPLLQKHYQQGLPAVVSRIMDVLGQEADCLRSQAEAWCREDQALTAGQKRGRGGNDFARLHSALQRRVLQARLHDLGVSATYDLIESLRESAPEPGQANLDSGRQIHHDGHGRLSLVALPPSDFPGEALEVALKRSGGKVSFACCDMQWIIRKLSRGHRPRARAGHEWFDADQVGPTIILRHWQPGDRFQPIGSSHEVKVQNLFTNLKVPRADRMHRVVATTREGDIWWIEGIRIGERYKVRSSTRSRLEWRWQRGDETGRGSG